ncbi:MAG: acyltransferase [Eubacteriales bacterium]|nr:acyltransferase [Eubacteriales bacterium]
MTEAQFRNKVTWFSFVFSLLVIWVHSYNAQLFLGLTGDMAIVYRAEHRIGEAWGQIAVPGFFMISGYLFYRDFTWAKLQGKWNRRIRSLIVPFILWNFIYYAGYVIGSRIPGISEVVGKGVVPVSLHALTDAVVNYRYNYVFWYLYQLILLTALAPVLYVILRRVWSRVLLLTGLWVIIELELSLPLVNGDALLYYSTAAALALGSETVSAVKPAPSGMAEEAWSVRGAVLGALMAAAAVWTYNWGLSHAVIPGFVLCRMLAVAGLWLMVPGERLPAAREFMCHNFFLYATHFAFVRFINKAFSMVFHVTLWEPYALFLVMPVLVLAISSGLGRALRRFLPGLWNVLNGYRT